LSAIVPAFRKRVRNKLFANRNFGNAIFWVAAFATGAVSVGYTLGFRWVEDFFRSATGRHSFLVWVLPPVGFFLSWWLVRTLAPEAGGRGIPQVLAANSHPAKKHSFVHRMLSLRGAAVKIASSLLCLAGGGAVGREGPTLQISASIFHFFRRFSLRISGAHDTKPWIVAGAAAGLASAFNTPLGGLVYAIEELGLAHFQKWRTALISAVIVAGLVSQWLLGSYLYLGFPKLQRTGFSFLPLAVAVGIAGGLLGAAFGKLLGVIVGWTTAIKKASVAGLIAVACGLVLAGLAALDPRAAGTGKGIITDMLFHGQTGGWLLVAIRFFSTVVTACSGVAGGIFAPSLAIGAALGSAMAELFRTPHANLMIMLGMIGFLTGVTRTPFTSFVLVLEMTDRHSAIFPMMLAALAASASARFVAPRSFYETMRNRLLSSRAEEKAASPTPPQER